MKRHRTEYFTARKIGLAINRFGMIKAGDKVLVGVSGGKDSLTLLKVLIERKKWIPIDYDVKAIHVINDYDREPEKKISRLQRYFKELGCDYIIKEIKIKAANKLKKEDCFWCSWNRRKVVFQVAENIGYDKIAFGHHKDDVAETILMNLFFNGEISGINPVQSLFSGKITVIRPLILLEEKDIKDYVKNTGIPVIESCCPRDTDSKRKLIKMTIRNLSKEVKNIKANILKAPTRIRSDYISDIDG